MIVIFSVLFGVFYYSLVAFGMVVGFQTHGPAGYLMVTAAGWAGAYSGVYTHIAEIVRTEPLFPLWPKDEKDKEPTIYTDETRWQDDEAPGAWQALMRARDAAARWYEVRYLPPRHVFPEPARVILEYGLLGLGWVSVGALLCLAKLYLWPDVGARVELNIAINWLDGIWLIAFAVYAAWAWLGPWAWNKPWTQWNRWRLGVGDDVENPNVVERYRLTQQVVDDLGGWAKLGGALDQACGQGCPEAPRLTVATIGKALGLAVPAIAKLAVFGPAGNIRSIAVVNGAAMFGLALMMGYFLVQFWRILVIRWQARRPSRYSPCLFLPLRALLDYLRRTGRVV